MQHQLVVFHDAVITQKCLIEQLYLQHSEQLKTQAQLLQKGNLFSQAQGKLSLRQHACRPFSCKQQLHCQQDGQNGIPLQLGQASSGWLLQHEWRARTPWQTAACLHLPSQVQACCIQRYSGQLQASNTLHVVIVI